jgi:hypothetical protein
MAITTKEGILSRKDTGRCVPFEVPAWGETVYIKLLTLGEKTSFEKSFVKQRGKETWQDMENFTSKLLCACLCDENGKLLFEMTDASLVAELLAEEAEPIFDECMRVNKYAQKNVEETAKN